MNLFAFVVVAVIKLSMLSSKLQSVEQEDYESKLKLYEKLGDAAAGLSHFKQALKYYHLMVNGGKNDEMLMSLC